MDVAWVTLNAGLNPLPLGVSRSGSYVEPKVLLRVNGVHTLGMPETSGSHVCMYATMHVDT